MSPSRPYLLRAIYDWLVDNALTPYLMVDALYPGVDVPQQYIEDGSIVLNIAPRAVGGLSLGNEAVEFNARFSGIGRHVYVPVMAVKAVYSFENGRGMVFEEEEVDGGDAGKDVLKPKSTKDSKSSGSKPKKPSLKIVK